MFNYVDDATNEKLFGRDVNNIFLPVLTRSPSSTSFTILRARTHTGHVTIRASYESINLVLFAVKIRNYRCQGTNKFCLLGV